MARKILLKENGLSGSESAPNGYKYFGDDSGSLSQKSGATVSSLGGLSYKVYTALLTQTGTASPVATVLENTVGSVIIGYDVVGGYYIENPLFEDNKTLVLIGSLTALNHVWFAQCYQPQVYINTYDSGIASDSILGNTSIEIRVYN